ncbi:hydroxysqualene dehydroxylase HpnE [Methylobacillus arboreus]|uniref:hydroxysqualene dehydroxylase HpnE n=1 Tax=Methylobacillus arboreus TaxID=755170 RepID=UPI001E480F24|nr:hydroxysqualene dehydroxylase HpnE [Methylobacillus arboreus]MCB5189751.1 hydroxysqualene dehydroxylase HpnE [Methylobacillus arboreus]
MGTQLTPHVAVIGGGCAGLAAAVALTRAGVKTTLLDSSHQLGGRARGIGWQGVTLDNGQHILLGAYVQSLKLLQTCGVDIDANILRLPLKLEIPGEFSLTGKQRLPAPLHILFGLLQAQGLTLGERLAAVRFMASLRFRQFRLPADMPLQQLLATQPPRLIAMLWEPLCLAALNTPLATASAQTFLNVLRDSFARRKSDSDLLLPRADLSILIAEPAARFIKVHGSEIRLNTPVESLRERPNGIQLKFKEASEDFSHVVVATSPFRVAALLQSLPGMKETVSRCEALDYQPIYTVYLQYSPEIRLPNPMCGLANQLGQWVFDRGQLYGQAGLVAVVISAEGRHQGLTQASLAINIHQELQIVFPILQTITPLWHKVVAEKRATFACIAGLQRPGQTTAHPHIWLAGDYVGTGDTLLDYPATIEGAVRSGFQAAKNIINSL